MIQSGYNWDLASAFVKAIDYPEAVRGEIFIISCKRAITLGQYLQTGQRRVMTVPYHLQDPRLLPPPGSMSELTTEQCTGLPRTTMV